MTVLLLRHVHAGDRDTWSGPDRDRPVSAEGARQAAALVDAYADHDVVAVWSSPYVRCRGSVEPLAAARDLVVEEHDDLAEGTLVDAATRLLRRATRLTGGDHRAVVCCTHGDVLEAVLADLERRGARLPTHRLPKGGTFVLSGELDAPTLGYLPPPA